MLLLKTKLHYYHAIIFGITIKSFMLVECNRVYGKTASSKKIKPGEKWRGFIIRVLTTYWMFEQSLNVTTDLKNTTTQTKG